MQRGGSGAGPRGGGGGGERGGGTFLTSQGVVGQDQNKQQFWHQQIAQNTAVQLQCNAMQLHVV